MRVLARKEEEEVREELESDLRPANKPACLRQKLRMQVNRDLKCLCPSTAPRWTIPYHARVSLV